MLIFASFKIFIMKNYVNKLFKLIIIFEKFLVIF